MNEVTMEKPVVGEDEIREATERLRFYKAAKARLDARVKEDEDWWRLRQWHYFKDAKPTPHKPTPSSAWLFNSVINKHADMMDNFPEPNILPREQSDEETAKVLSSVVPVVLERSDFEKTYSENGWEKLKKGTGIYGIFWDNGLQNGLGDVNVQELDILNVFWEPGVTDIQDSKDLFIVSLWDIETLAATYPDIPDLDEKVKGNMHIMEEYHTEIDDAKKPEKAEVIDWYYKRVYNGHKVLHYAQYVNDVLIYASENDPKYILTGYYEHGEYPVVFDPLFPDENSPGGFGYIDIMRSPQEFIDKLDSALLKNALVGSKPRVLASTAAGINMEDFSDTEKDVVEVQGSIDDTRVRFIQPPQLPGIYAQIRQNKIDELKETSGNRDFSQGTTTAGVTAASAIAALQEAGSKTSRDLNKGSYRAFTAVCYQVIELIRQFYDEARAFRIIGEDMAAKYIMFDNTGIKPEMMTNEYGMDIQGRLPVFDIKVRPAKSSPFSRLSQNELALQLFGAGIFNPELADQAIMLIDMMDFEGKDKIREKIAQNQQLFKMAQYWQAVAMQTGAALQTATGDSRPLEAMMAQGGGQAMPGAVPELQPEDRSMAGKARQRAAESAEVR